MKVQSGLRYSSRWIAIIAGTLFAGIGIGYLVFTLSATPKLFIASQQSPQSFDQLMNGWMQNSSARQQLMSQMMQNPQFMQEWMANRNFQQNWMYPYMMQNWRMGTGMGPGMMSGFVIGSGPNPINSQAISTNQVYISPNSWNAKVSPSYQPEHIVVKAGTTVVWTNKDSVAHTVTDSNNVFDSNLISPGETWSHTFKDGGTYNYYCTIHPWMRGAVEVES